MLAGVDHFAPIFHEEVDGGMIAAPDDPAGERTVEVILRRHCRCEGEPELTVITERVPGAGFEPAHPRRDRGV